ncbi:MAG: 23S rRNA (adenine(2503)-C(2))-methyltransferase RlmN [Candidatus Cloacimonadales bacterium]|jgi:23S rRNA (adenine2503-C2)-methyltransferase|nr:23S rRNA (adenine(2503)-C(2))-methyltransferase RlmN [Candidatus Cloacimonadota bacterium]MDY0380825.1 23S rRNA (adenine(2503)-C(2))-methyltransferase RlmN [Candidatus Cloacimonadaceae bacterium]MCB5256499.1 23S rRNA (adenine(2503)-C(2))-methyltransferase RlmN [Candidatus Cloacimonadota bacterium]MCB5264590.1 23S rRNA (adenine(2503)-C(2))-methyltransferase RlmN [Candidatus Cloacimonadota bacterium]MCB5276791.1 23S rRNA (adenine(2503)-C(2))-methyltransferase RlmN [Candidatus Cloacimonadota ba
MSINIFAQKPEAIQSALKGKFADFRYKQFADWFYKKLVFDPNEATNLPKDFRDYISGLYSWQLPKIDLSFCAPDQTTKYRLKLEDDSKIEMVLIPAENKRTLCVSSQVGCARGCSFCATGTMGIKRNLHSHEIVGQIMLAARLTLPHRLSNLVFMGMGEPMDNLDTVLESLAIIQSPMGLAFSPRRTTVSTCGIPKGIIRLADSGIRTKLAVSLNSAIDEKRNRLMPVNRRHPLSELKEALRYYLSKTSFRVTFEYIMIPEVNMGDEDIKALRRFAGDLSCKVNFIPYNTVPQLPYRSPSENEIDLFMAKAQSLNQAVTLRRSRGAEIYGACGQLAGYQGEIE